MSAGPHGVGGSDRAVARVLVVVEEHRTVRSLLLPPLGRHAPGHATLELTPDRDRGMPDVDELPARLDAHVDVHALAARGLGPADHPELLEDAVQLSGHVDRVGEVGAGTGVEVEAKLVGAVDVAAAYGPRVEGDRAQLRGPGDDGEVGRRDLVSRASGGEGDVSRLDVGRSPLRHPLLVERVALEPLTRRDLRTLDHSPGPPLQGRGPVAQRAQDPVAAVEIVLHHLELGDPDRREIGLLGVAHSHHVLADGELDRGSEGLRHEVDATRIGRASAGIERAG